MERRRFLWICGFTGLGAIIGLHPAKPGYAANFNNRGTTLHHKPAWMHGSIKTGCARLPDIELFDADIEPPATQEL